MVLTDGKIKTEEEAEGLIFPYRACKRAGEGMSAAELEQ